MPTLQQFKYLVAVSQSLHFRKAAEASHVTQPTLSAQLKELEDKLGVQLVERSRTKVILTPIGAEIARRAERLLRDVDEIKSIAREGANPTSGTLRIGLVQSLGSYFLPHVVPALHRVFPELKLYPREGEAADLQMRLETGSLDLIFFPLPYMHKDMESLPLFREPLRAVMPANHSLTQFDRIPPHALGGERVMTLESGHNLHDQVAQICAEVGAELSLDFGGTSLDTLRQMVTTGLGISLLPALYIRSEVTREPLLTSRPMAGLEPSRDIGMIWRATSARTPVFHSIADLIRGTLSNSAPELTILTGEADK